MRLYATAALALAGLTYAQGTVVTVSNGPIAGTTTIVPLATATARSATVTKYVGIPFASSPPLRFAPPNPVSTWTTTLQAVTTQPACIQQFPSLLDESIFNNPGGPNPAESEDCLYLNVYVPPGTKPNSDLPVMFWIFGGNLNFGTGGLPYYDGSSFAANQGVILVTHNYRTNIFGFSMSPQLPLSQRNVGFLDQRLALQWVYNNIAAFGGSPSKITIFGESAGGMSVEQLLAYPPSPLPYRGAILQSRALAGPPNGSSGWTAAVLAAGCATAANQLNCMRGLTTTALKSAVAGISFGPVLDGTTYTNDIRPRLGAGAAMVPVLAGTNGQEGNVFAYLLGLDGPSPNITAALQSYFPTGSSIVEDLLDVVIDLGDDLGDSAFEIVSNLVTDYEFTCTTRLLTNSLYSAGYNVWRYYYNASFPDLAAFPNSGAFHTSEIPQVFGTYPLSDQYGVATPQQNSLSRYMQTAWANFAKNPSGGPGWSQLGFFGHVEFLGNNGNNGGSSGYTVETDYLCPLFDVIISAEGY